MQVKVTLRESKIQNGLVSLYLDFWPKIELNGRLTRRQFLNIHTHQKPKNPLQRDERKRAIARAEALLRKKENELAKQELYTTLEWEAKQRIELTKGSFIDFIRKEAEFKFGSNTVLWSTTANHLQSYKGNIQFSEVTSDYAKGFRVWLQERGLSNQSQLIYFNTLKSAIGLAREEGRIIKGFRMEKIKREERQMEYLTLDEVKLLAKTPSRHVNVKQAFLFSVFTGLRYGDVKSLHWDDVSKTKSGWEIRYTTEKAGNEKRLPISDEAYSYLMEQAEGGRCFPGLPTNASKYLEHWMGRTGIARKVNFHASRHTYATLQVLAGTPITDISKLMDHKSIETTMRYVKMLDGAGLLAATKISFK